MTIEVEWMGTDPTPVDIEMLGSTIIDIETYPGMPGPPGPEGPSTTEALGTVGLRRAVPYLRRALAAGTARVVHMGDSKVEGTGVGLRSQRWQDLVTAGLRQRFPGGDAGTGYIPGHYFTFFGLDAEPVRSGTTAVADAGGFGRRQVQLLAAGASSTWTGYGSRVRVWCSKDPGTTGVLEVLVAGSKVGEITGLTGTAASGFYTDFAVALGNRSVKVQTKASTGNGKGYVDGVEFRSATTGVLAWDAAHAGFGAATYLEAASAGHWQTLAAVDPHLVTVGLGSNDFNSGPDSFEASVRALADKIVSTCPQAGLLWVMSAPTQGSLSTYADYAARLRTVLAGYQNASIVWEGELFAPAPTGDADPLNRWTDEDGGIHPNVLGNQAIADAVLTHLLGGPATDYVATTSDPVRGGGFKAWNYDPVALTTSSAPESGFVYGLKLYLPTDALLSTIYANIITGGSSLNAGQCFAAVYDAAGKVIGATADQSSAWATAGFKTMALTAPVMAKAGALYVALLANGSGCPAFSRCGGGAWVNGALSGMGLRFFTAASGQTSMPANIGTPTQTFSAFWAAVS